ncbi:MAG: hypothetical protein RL172_167 [Bacteroidota bacterium]
MQQITTLAGPGTDVQLSMVRFDQLHPVISGNKLFKLHYYLQDKPCSVVTFGGPYSNHLVATAFACQLQQIACTGMVRGEQPCNLSHTLLQCQQLGMQLEFLSRQQYDSIKINTALGLNKSALVIPEGGYGPLGAKGAALMCSYIPPDTTHICCAAGTATTIAGLLLGKQPQQQIIAVPVLKGMTDIPHRLQYLTSQVYSNAHLHIADGYDFGGYAKKTPELLSFMNTIYQQYQLPLDFVYTAKMLYAVFNLVQNGYFAAGSRIACLHTGGLQGNLSLPAHTLTF